MFFLMPKRAANWDSVITGQTVFSCRFRSQNVLVFTNQLPLPHWSEVIADPAIGDALRDRLEHASLTLNITGESYRGVKARKLATKKHSA